MRFHLYEDMKDGLLGRDDYMEMYAGYEDRQRKAEKIIETLSRQIDEIKEEKTDKYDWLSYFTEYRNLPKLTRLAAVEMIDNIRIHDKKHIDVTFRFDDCYKKLYKELNLDIERLESVHEQLKQHRETVEL